MMNLDNTYLTRTVSVDDERLESLTSGIELSDELLGTNAALEIAAYTATCRSTRSDRGMAKTTALYAHLRAQAGERVLRAWAAQGSHHDESQQLIGEVRALRLMAAMLDGESLEG